MNITQSKIPAQARSKYWNNSTGGSGKASGGGMVDISGKLDKSIWDENINATETLIELLKATKIKGDGEVTGNLTVKGEATTFSLDGVEVNSLTTASEYLNDLLDVNITNPSNNQYLKYNGTEWINSGISYTELTNIPSSFTPSSHTHTKSNITDFPTSMPASDVYSWAKAANKPSYTAAEVGAHANSWNPTSLSDSGRKEPETGANRPSVYGLTMNNAYSANWPNMYGNVITMKGGGDNQLFLGWSGTSGAHSDAFIRSRRDVVDANWSGWAKIFTDANSNNSSTDWTCKQIWIGGHVQSRITSENSSHLHYYTDASDSHWFNKAVRVHGEIYAGSAYNSLVYHSGNSNLRSVDWNAKTLGVSNIRIAYGGQLIDETHNVCLMRTGWDNAYGDFFEIRTTGTASQKLLTGGSNGVLNWGGEFKSNSISIGYTGNCKAYMSGSEGAADTYASWTTYNWYNTAWQVGIRRGGSTDYRNFSISKNGVSYIAINDSDIYFRNRIGLGCDPTITMAIGDSDTGFNWHSDGLISAYANGVQLFNWNSQRVYYNHLLQSNAGAEFRGNVTAGSAGEGNCFFRPATAGYSWGSGIGALTIDVLNNGNQTPLLISRRAGTDGTGANRLFFIEQLNTGDWVYIGLKGSPIMRMSAGGALYIDRSTEIKNNLIVKGEATTYTLDGVQTTSAGMTREAYVTLAQYQELEQRLIALEAKL